MFGARKKRKEEARKAVFQVINQFLVQRGMEKEYSMESGITQPGLGLDSIGCLELFAEIERKCRIQIPEKYWGRTSNLIVKDLVDITLKCQ
jgi:acyl carrier protein